MVRMSRVLWVLLVWATVACGLPQNAPNLRVTVSDSDDAGEPLFLTPYLEKGNLTEARRLAKVALNDNLQFESYAGFFTVNKTYDSNQFFWYFPSMSEDKEKAPVAIWLQGGPGASSMFGLFTENGPITVNNGQLERREYHWALNHHLIYIDNPVGTGFSFTNSSEGYCTDETQVGEQLYSTLTQFFQLFPELQHNDFFITGESYAGHYVPALAHTIIKNKSKAKTKINLKGLAIGGAWINPDSQKHFERRKHVCENSQNIELTKAGRMFNSLLKLNLKDEEKYMKVLITNSVRKAIHVGNLQFDDLNNEVYDKLSVDSCQSVAPWLSKILEDYPVTLYGGDIDDIVPYCGIADFLRNHFNFTGADEYKVADQYSWKVDGEEAGCVRRARLLTDIYVRNATHFVPTDQPKRAWDMITRITHAKGFDQKEGCTIPC